MQVGQVTEQESQNRKRRRIGSLDQNQAVQGVQDKECNPTSRKSTPRAKCKEMSASIQMDLRAWIKSAHSAKNRQRNGFENGPDPPEDKANQQT